MYTTASKCCPGYTGLPTIGCKGIYHYYSVDFTVATIIIKIKTPVPPPIFSR